MCSEHSKHRKATPTKFCSFTSSLCTCHLYSQWSDSKFLRTCSLTPGLTNNRFCHCHLRTHDWSQQTVPWIKEIPRTGSSDPVKCHLCIKCNVSIYGLVWFNIRKSLDAEKVEKLMKIYRFCRAEEDKQQTLFKLFELFLSFFQVLQIPLLFVLFHWKQICN